MKRERALLGILFLFTFTSFTSTRFPLYIPTSHIVYPEETLIYQRAFSEALSKAPSRNIIFLRKNAYERAHALFEKIYRENPLIPPRPFGGIFWDVATTSIGTINTETNSIHLNEILFLRNYDAYIEEVIPFFVVSLVYNNNRSPGHWAHDPKLCWTRDSSTLSKLFHKIQGGKESRVLQFGTHGVDHTLDIEPLCDLHVRIARLRIGRDGDLYRWRFVQGFSCPSSPWDRIN